MGTPKALLPLGKTNFLNHLIGLYREAGIGEIWAVGGAAYEEIKASNPPCHLVFAKDWARGMRASLRAGILAMGEGPILLTHVDRPVIAVQTIQKLIDPAIDPSGQKVKIPCYQGKTGHPVCLPAAIRARLIQEEDQPLCEILEGYPKIQVETDDPDILQNINRPEDWKALCDRFQFDSD